MIQKGDQKESTNNPQWSTIFRRKSYGHKFLIFGIEFGSQKLKWRILLIYREAQNFISQDDFIRRVFRKPVLELLLSEQGDIEALMSEAGAVIVWDFTA